MPAPLYDVVLTTKKDFSSLFLQTSPHLPEIILGDPGRYWGKCPSTEVSFYCCTYVYVNSLQCNMTAKGGGGFLSPWSTELNCFKWWPDPRTHRLETPSLRTVRAVLNFSYVFGKPNLHGGFGCCLPLQCESCCLLETSQPIVVPVFLGAVTQSWSWVALAGARHVTASPVAGESRWG